MNHLFDKFYCILAIYILIPFLMAVIQFPIAAIVTVKVTSLSYFNNNVIYICYTFEYIHLLYTKVSSY